MKRFPFWIRVCDALPGDSRIVQAWIKDNKYKVAELARYYHDLKKWKTNHGNDMEGTVTHWADFLEQPKDFIHEGSIQF